MSSNHSRPPTALLVLPFAFLMGCNGNVDIAGPGGATEGKPVGLVHMACAREGRETLHEARVFDGDRAAVRSATVRAALAMLLAMARG